MVKKENFLIHKAYRKKPIGIITSRMDVLRGNRSLKMKLIIRDITNILVYDIILFPSFQKTLLLSSGKTKLSLQTQRTWINYKQLPNMKFELSLR